MNPSRARLRYQSGPDLDRRDADDSQAQSGHQHNSHHHITGDPIRFGIISNLAHSGGNITGVSVDAGVEVWGKRLSLLRQAVPDLKRVAFVATLGCGRGAGGRAVVDAAPGLGIEIGALGKSIQ